MTFDTSLYSIIGILSYIYVFCFEFILIKMINYVNMTINSKNDEFNFNNTFLQKIENLEIILQFYNGDPLKAVKNLNTIYTNYKQYFTSKIKNKSIDINKKKFKNTSDENKKTN